MKTFIGFMLGVIVVLGFKFYFTELYINDEIKKQKQINPSELFKSVGEFDTQVETENESIGNTPDENIYKIEIVKYLDKE